jgi:predicted dehydrogenase
MKNVSIALIGAGYVANEHARALRQLTEARIVAVFDAAKDRAAELAKTYETTTAGSFEEAIGKADIAWLCSPPLLHEEQIVASLSAGRAVFCEKPLTLSPESARRIEKAVAKSGKFVAVGHSNRYYPAYQKARELFASGSLGSFVSVWSQRIGYYPRRMFPPWRLDTAQSGGMTVEVGVHEIDWLQWIGGDVESVFAQQACAVINPPEFDDSLSAVVRFKSGGFGRLDLSWASGVDIARRGILGDKSSLMVDRFLTSVEVCPLDQPAQVIETPSPVHTTTKENLGFLWQAQDVLRNLTAGKPHSVGVKEGAAAVIVARALQASARENRKVDVAEFAGS